MLLIQNRNEIDWTTALHIIWEDIIHVYKNIIHVYKILILILIYKQWIDILRQMPRFVQHNLINWIIQPVKPVSGSSSDHHGICMLYSTYLKNGTILSASTSAVLNPWEYNMTWAMSGPSGLVIARLQNRKLIINLH